MGTIQVNKLVIIVLVVCIVIVSAGLLVSRRESTVDGPDGSIDPSSAPMESRKVFIEGFHIYQDSHDPRPGAEAQGSIENTLYTYVSIDNKPGLYTGTIRPNSLKETSETGAELLVDIEPSKVTYLIKLLNPEKKGYRPISVACAPQNQQIDPEAQCIDGGLPL